MSRGVLLVGHGSHLDANSSTPVYAHARRLRESGRFDEVMVAFWKEEPSLSRGLEGCTADDVAVVPVFISRGYFTEQVIPREMRLEGRLTRCGERVVRYTEPVGSHASLARVIEQRAREAGAGVGDVVAVLGHGTPRNPNSERNVYDQAERVAAEGLFAEVVTLFIDQEPSMERVFEVAPGRDIYVVPLFIADGWHVGQTIPADLALDGPVTRRDGRRVIYARAVGTHPGVAEVAAELAEEAFGW